MCKFFVLGGDSNSFTVKRSVIREKKTNGLLCLLAPLEKSSYLHFELETNIYLGLWFQINLQHSRGTDSDVEKILTQCKMHHRRYLSVISTSAAATQFSNAWSLCE